MSATWRIRQATPADLPFLRQALYLAACWDARRSHPPADEVLADPHNARYLAGWGRPGDAGVVAVDEEGRVVGAAWYRLFPATEPGYGFLDPAIPELSIGVAPEWRGRGVGAALLAALIARARADGLPALSLSVAADNPAGRLYERIGFRRVALEGGSWTMRLGLRS